MQLQEVHVDSTELPKIAKVCVYALCMQTWLPCASGVSLQTHSMIVSTTNADLTGARTAAT